MFILWQQIKNVVKALLTLQASVIALHGKVDQLIEDVEHLRTLLEPDQATTITLTAGPVQEQP